MTFKHVKFDDSMTMRSLERLAKEKGWVKPELVKTAEAAQPDYTISGNLMENVLKLCAGLRNLGFDKYANELEEKFIVYKQANSLYEISSETGDDVIDTAHPKGSHKLEGVEGDATVETIIDQHLKMVEVSNKKPTGKLASQSDILNAVKKALGQGFGQEYHIENFLAPQTTTAPEKVVKDVSWTDGNRANSKFIQFDMANAAVPLTKVVGLLSQLEKLASDQRFPAGTAAAVKQGKDFIQSFATAYLTACSVAAKKAQEIESSRLSNINELDQSRVTFKEVGSAFKSGMLAKTAIGKADSFTSVVDAVKSMSKGLGSLIFDKFSPGFDFEEPFMKSVKDRAMQLFAQIKSELGSE
jgi:hypothetical protein